MPNKYLDSVGLAEYTSLIKAELAPKNSPALTGTPTAPTPTAGDDSTKIATTEFVQDAINSEETRADGKYLPFTGGAITGDLSVNGTLTGNVTGNLTGDVTGTASGNLPLSGGIMTGNIRSGSNELFVLRKENTSYGIQLWSGTAYNNGASISLYGKDFSQPGIFNLGAYNGTQYSILHGEPNGTLTWGGNDIITSAGGTINGQVVINRNNNSTAGGLKFTGAGQNYVINVLNTNVTKGTAPSSSQYWGINFYGKDSDNYNKRIGMLESYLTSANVSLTAIRAYNCTTNTNTVNAAVEVSVDGSGNQSAKALGKEIERVNASGSKYIRYDSGVQICWGETTNISSATTVTITFPVAFKAYDGYGISIGRWWAAATENYYLSDRTTTSIKLTTVGTVSGGNHSYYYIAVGYWK